MNRVFIDMDGVIVNYDAFTEKLQLTPEEAMLVPDAFLVMQPIEGAIDAVRRIIAMGFEVWIATKPPIEAPQAYADKASWIVHNLPELKHRIIMTQDKGLLGDRGDLLIDDRPYLSNADSFPGFLMKFSDIFHWKEVLIALEQRKYPLRFVHADSRTEKGERV